MSEITHRNGNLLAAPQRIIAHGCNARGVMGSGAAKDIKQAYPGAFEAYRDKFERDGLNLGEVIPWVGDTRIVLNLITQENYGREPGVVYVDYEAVRTCMRRIETAAKRHQAAGAGAFHEYREVAFPRIGSGLGGGSWDQIAEIISIEVQSVRVFVYTPR